MKNKKVLSKLTLNGLQEKMKENGWSQGLIDEVAGILKDKETKLGEKDFQKWLYELDYQCPDEFKNEEFALVFYKKHTSQIEEEVIKLEKETNLSWEVQTEDLHEVDEKVRKVQLVIRHRLTDFVLDLLD